MALDPKHTEPAGNLPERSVAGPEIIWWVLALAAVVLFCLLAWFLHDGSAGLTFT